MEKRFGTAEWMFCTTGDVFFIILEFEREKVCWGYEMQLKKEKKMKLLEYFAVRMGCIYLSDLHQLCYLEEIHRLLPEVNAEIYDVAEWSDAIFYLTNEKRFFETQAEAKAFLANFDFSKASSEGRI